MYGDAEILKVVSAGGNEGGGYVIRIGEAVTN